MSPLNRKLTPINSRLAGYATLAGAALAAPAIPSADATIIWSGPVSINIPSTTAGVYLNVVTGVSNVSPASAPGWDVNPWNSSSLNMFTSTSAGGNGTALGGVGVYVGTGSTYFNLAFGTVISGASTFGGTGTNTIAGATPLNLSSSNNLVGFRFFNEGSAATNFGWMRISLSATAGGQPRAIVEYAYDNAGGSITAGQVPEPSTVALFGVMAAGALGVRAWRKRKAA
jgi:hypothetical protein